MCSQADCLGPISNSVALDGSENEDDTVPDQVVHRSVLFSYPSSLIYSLTGYIQSSYIVDSLLPNAQSPIEGHDFSTYAGPSKPTPQTWGNDFPVQQDDYSFFQTNEYLTDTRPWSQPIMPSTEEMFYLDPAATFRDYGSYANVQSTPGFDPAPQFPAWGPIMGVPTAISVGDESESIETDSFPSKSFI